MVMSDRMCRIITERRRSVKRIGSSDPAVEEQSKSVSNKSNYVDNAEGLAYTQRTPSHEPGYGGMQAGIRMTHIHAAGFDGGRIA